MKIFKLTFITVLVAVFALSCKEGSDDCVIISIDNTKITPKLDVSEQIEQIQITELQEKEGSFMGTAFKLFVHENYVIIYDRFQTHKINLFNQNGEFLKTILKTGDGPNDAFQINDVFMDSKGQIQAYDFGSKKIYKFDSAYNLKEVLKIAEQNVYKSIYQISEGNYVSYSAFNEYNPKFNGQYYHLALLDNKFNVEKVALSYDKKYQGIEWLTFRNNFYLFGDTLRLIQPYDSYIYNIGNNLQIQKAYKIAYKDSPLPKDVLNNIVADHLAVFKNRNAALVDQSRYFEKYTKFEGTWLESRNNIFLISINHDNSTFVSLINKNYKYSSNSARVLQETKRYKMLLPYFMTFNDKNNSYYTVIDGKSLNMYLNKESVYQGRVKNQAEVLYLVKTQFKL